MSISMIDYGCHSFSYRLANTLRQCGVPITYLANGSLESPNLSSLSDWVVGSPGMVRSIVCDKPYGKIGLSDRLKGELEWGRRCVADLQSTRPKAIIVNCVPLTAVTSIHRWAESQKVPFIYWLQDIQSRAIHDLLGRKLGMPGRTLGALAHLWEQDLLERSDMVITIAPGHEKHLPPSVLREGRHALLENWANIEEFPQFPIDNEWSRRHGIAETFNIMYSGTLGLKHDLSTFIELAKHFSSNPQVRVVIISSGQAAQELIEKARALQLTNLILLPFQPYAEVPKALASASVLVAPLEASAGAFCVPSKVLSYLCAGRPTVIAIDADNAAAATIRQADAGYVVQPGDPVSFLASVDSLLNNPGKRFAMGKSARTYAQSTFAIQNVVQKFLSILHRVDPALAVPWVAASAVAS